MLLAEIEAGVLVRSLIIAALVVTPYALHKRRQLQRQRAALAGPDDAGSADTGSQRPRLEDVIAGFTEAATTAHEQGAVTVTVPADVTVDGADAPDGVVDALVRDALRRSGLVTTSELDTAAGRTIECQPAPPSAR